MDRYNTMKNDFDLNYIKVYLIPHREHSLQLLDSPNS
jgi:hypothetical protein